MARTSPKDPPAAARAPDVEDELVAEGLTLVPERDEIDAEAPGVVLAPDLVERSEIASYLLPSAFPASRAAIVRIAKREGAPPELRAYLNRLPAGTYATVGEIWEALGGPVEHRDTGDAPVDTGPSDAEVAAMIRDAVEEVVDVAPAAGPNPAPTPRAPRAAPTLTPPPSESGPAPWVDAVAAAAGQFTTWWVRMSLAPVDAMARALLRR